MRDFARNLTTFINHNTISTGCTAIIDAPIFHDRELVVRPFDTAEAEAFIVLVWFWIPESLVLEGIQEKG